MYKFRRVEMSDEDILLDWINDPVTRRMSINSSEIKPEDHNIWFSSILNSNTSAIYIYEKVTKTRINTPVASMRIDKVNNRNYLSWNVSGKMRKKGIGGKMLSDFVKEHKGKYFAKIKVNNPASMAICSKSGFSKYYSKGNMTYWRNF